MAHLLRLPANTVSRALAAIYSPGKHHVLTDAPHFFSIPMSPEKIRMESEPSNQPVDSLYLFHGEETFTIPENSTKTLSLSVFNNFNKLDLYRPLESTIHSVPKLMSMLAWRFKPFPINIREYS
jgi:hypothetical protein